MGINGSESLLLGFGFLETVEEALGAEPVGEEVGPGGEEGFAGPESAAVSAGFEDVEFGGDRSFTEGKVEEDGVFGGHAGVIAGVKEEGGRGLGSDLKFYDIGAPLPLVFSYGASIDLVSNEEQGMRLTAYADANKPQDSEQLFFTSGELALKDMFFLRGGYKLNYSGVTDSKIDEVSKVSVDAGRSEEGYTLGAGVKLPMSSFKISVDYAYTDFGILDQVHRITMDLGF